MEKRITREEQIERCKQVLLDAENAREKQALEDLKRDVRQAKQLYEEFGYLIEGEE